MLVYRNSFSLNSQDIERVHKAILLCGKESEDIINSYLHKIGGKKMSDSMTKYLPLSKTGKNHAKFHKWFEQDNYNLSVSITNSTKGKRETSFYYLYYVFTGTGTSKRRGKNDAMIKGFKHIENEMVNDIVDLLDKNVEMEMNKDEL